MLLINNTPSLLGVTIVISVMRAPRFTHRTKVVPRSEKVVNNILKLRRLFQTYNTFSVLRIWSLNECNDRKTRHFNIGTLKIWCGRKNDAGKCRSVYKVIL